MFKKSQSALDQYKQRRGGEVIEPPSHVTRMRRFRHWRTVRLGAFAGALALTWLALRIGEPVPVTVTYDLDLSEADRGTLVITMIIDGDLPGDLDLVFPPGIFGDDRNGVSPGQPTGRALGPDGSLGNPLPVIRTDDGWRLATRGAKRAGFIYRVDLDRVQSSEEDVRRHISSPVPGGVRAAGFEIFLEPAGVRVKDITVAMHNPTGMPVLVPWPALLKGSDLVAERRRRMARQASEASLGMNEGFRPANLPTPAPQAPQEQDLAARLPSNLLYHPRDLADLNNALIICGNIRTLESRARDTVIQFATDREWNFEDERALDLIRRIARTEMGFFGSAPTDQITVLLAANDITAEAGFDVYGIHTGSSVLVMLSPETTWGMLEEQAASVIAHEMFHGWLGEAIPQSDPNMLWFTEGATSWYAARMLVSAGVWTADHATGMLRARIQRDYLDNPVHGKLSPAAAAAEVMADADQVRYGYAAGMNACMALDAMLARTSGDLAPLDEVMRALYEGRDRGPLTRELLEQTILDVTGIHCGAWFDTHVYGKTALPPSERLI